MVNLQREASSQACCFVLADLGKQARDERFPSFSEDGLCNAPAAHTKTVEASQGIHQGVVSQTRGPT